MAYKDPPAEHDSRSRRWVARARKQFLNDADRTFGRSAPRRAILVLQPGVDAVIDSNIRGEGRVDERTMEAARPTSEGSATWHPISVATYARPSPAEPWAIPESCGTPAPARLGPR